ncbi:tail fiber assembly protein [Escherichia coli]|uniref:tail fiber assembly protein n=1 Tax=Escherichia coli TaxID=562 RepID=UPI00406782CB
MDNAILNSELIAIQAGNIIVYNYDGGNREYISASTEYLAVGVGIPAHSCLDAISSHKAGYAILRSEDLSSWEYVPDHRGETVYSIDTGNPEEITVLGDYPENTTTIAPLTPYDKWDGEKWVVDTEAQHSAAVEAAETKRQSLIDTAMDSISLIQLKLRAGRKLTRKSGNFNSLTPLPDLYFSEENAERDFGFSHLLEVISTGPGTGTPVGIRAFPQTNVFTRPGYDVIKYLYFYGLFICFKKFHN